MTAVSADARCHIAVGGRTPDDAAGLTIQTHDPIGACRIDRRVGHSRREITLSRVTHIRAPDDARQIRLLEVRIIVRIMRARRREDAAAGQRQDGESCCESGEGRLMGHVCKDLEIGDCVVQQKKRKHISKGASL